MIVYVKHRLLFSMLPCRSFDTCIARFFDWKALLVGANQLDSMLAHCICRDT